MPPLHLSAPLTLSHPSPISPTHSPATFTSLIRAQHPHLSTFSPSRHSLLTCLGPTLTRYNVPDHHQTDNKSQPAPTILWQITIKTDADDDRNSDFLKSLPRPPGLPTSLAFSLDETTIAIGTSTGLGIMIALKDGRMYDWRCHTPSFLRSTLDGPGNFGGEGEEKQEKTTLRDEENTNTPNTVYAIKMAPSSPLFAMCGDDGNVTLHSMTDTLSNSPIATFSCRSDVTDDDLGEGFEQDEWQRARGFMQAFTVKLGMRGLDFSADGKTLLAGGETDVIDVWDVSMFEKGERRGGEGEVEVFSEPKRRIAGHNAWLNSITFFRELGARSATKTALSTSEVFCTADVLGKICLWSLRQKIIADTVMEQKFECLWLFRCHVSMVTSVCFSKEGDRMLTSGVDGKVAVWEVGGDLWEADGSIKPGRTYEQVQLLNKANRPIIQLGGHDGGVKMCGFADTGETAGVVEWGAEDRPPPPSSTVVVSCGTDQNVLFYHIPPPVKRVSHLALHSRAPHAVVKRDTVRGIVFSARNRYLVSFGIGCDVMVWEADSGRLAQNLVAHQRAIKAVDFLDEEEAGVVVVSGDEEGKIILWNLTPGPENGGAAAAEVGGRGLHHPEEEELVSFKHHRVPIRSVKFCGGVDSVVSCDATGKVLIVDCATQEIMSEFLGGDVSCSAWNFWSRRQRQDVFLVTAGLDKLVIWDSVSGMIESHQGVPPEGGYIEDYCTYTPKSFRDDLLMSVACCTDEGACYFWVPKKMVVVEEDEFALPKAPVRGEVGRGGEGEDDDEEDEEERRRKEQEKYKDLVDLMALVDGGSALKNGFRGVSFGNEGEIVAWGIHKVFLWLPVGGGGAGGGGDYVFHSQFTGGESIYGVSSARAVDDGCVQVVLEDGWSFMYKY